jgi:hypothetical protein
MASLEVPVRVSGGRIREGGVSNHATPLSGVQEELVKAAGPQVASVLGADGVAVEAANVGRTINVSFAPQESVRLVPLLSSLGKRPTTTAVAGVDRHGVPVILNLGDEATWHVVMLSDGGPQKSDWLRCLVASLALASKPSELQLLGVDLSGVELAFIDALPQALTDVAFRADTAIDLLAWLRDETDRRRALNRKAPQLVLVIDDLDRQGGAEPSQPVVPCGPPSWRAHCRRLGGRVGSMASGAANRGRVPARHCPDKRYGRSADSQLRHPFVGSRVDAPVCLFACAGPRPGGAQGAGATRPRAKASQPIMTTSSMTSSGTRSEWRRRPGRGLDCNELVHISGAGRNGLPTGFQWRGQHYRVATLDPTLTRRKAIEGVRVFSVRTTSGLRCQLEHRLVSDSWMMGSVLPSL